MTSGARDTIFKNFFSRSSRATGPKTRVPTGSPASLIRTAAFWSKRIYVPSRRPYSLRVRTITAFTTVPFLTCPSGDASFTLAVMTSPRLAWIPVEPPSGIIICSLRAPLLSATSSIDLIIKLITFPLAQLRAMSFASRANSTAPTCSKLVARRSQLLLHIHRNFRHQRRLAHHFLQPPALQLRQRSRLFEAYHIAHMRDVLLVMRVKFLGLRHHPDIQRVGPAADDFDHNRLLHAVRNHFADSFLASSHNVSFRHYFFSDFDFTVDFTVEVAIKAAAGVATEVAVAPARSRTIVFTRAMSLRSPRSLVRLSVCPMLS